MKEIPGVFMLRNEISIEAMEAQRKQDLAALMAFRSRHNAAYAAWSQPKAIAERKAQHEADAAKALAAGHAMAELAKAQVEAKKQEDEIRAKAQEIVTMLDEASKPIFKLSPIIRTAPIKLTLWQRLKSWWRS